MKKFLKMGILAAGMGVLATPGHALTQDGTLGINSTGTVDITATIDNLVLITGLATINLGTFTNAGDMPGSTTACVYTNLPSGLYNVTLTGDGGDGLSTAFTLYDGVANFLPYHVDYTDGAATTSADVATGTTLLNQQGNSTSQTCGGTPNTTVAVTVLQADAQAAPAGIYNGILTIFVEAL